MLDLWVSSSMSVNLTIKSVLASAWKLGEKVTFSPLHQGFLVCNFVLSGDLDNVLKLGQWNF